MKIHFIVHEVFEGPGAYESWAVCRGYEVSYSNVYLGDKLPTDTSSFDLLVVLGGPQRPSTTLDECAHFDAQSEIAFIKQAKIDNKAIIGVCLGAQLIGEALEADFAESPNKEIGVFPIQLTSASSRSHKFSEFPPEVSVGHWHGDMPGLSENAKIIAKSEGCPRQIIEYSPIVYGFQCHLEFTPSLIELLIAHSEAELAQLSGQNFVQSPDELRSNEYGEMNEVLYNFLDRLAEEYESQRIEEVSDVA